MSEQEQEIKRLVKELRTSNDEFTLWQATKNLEKIDPGNPVAIEALVELLRTSKDEYRLRQTAESLEKIGAGNPVAIEALVELLRTSKDEYRLRQTAESLEKIGAGNPVAIEALVETLLNSNRNTSIRQQRAKTLENIANGNIKLIEKLRNLRHNQDIYTRWLIDGILKKIDTSNTEEYTKQQWNSQVLKQIPLESLYYYQRLTFLEDQKNSLKVNLKNYQQCLQDIETITGQTPPKFFITFESTIKFYLEQIKTDIGFLSPALHLYDKLMLSVQTQVSIDEGKRQDNKEKKEAQLGQIFTGIGTAIAVGQLLTEPTIETISQYREPTLEKPSLTSIWLGTSFTIVISLLIGYLISVLAYRWLKKN